MSEVCLDEAVNRKKAVNEASFHDLDSLRNVAAEAIDSCAAELGNVSNDIWSHPELSYQEKQAHDVLVNFFTHHGFTVEPHFKLETAFRATWQLGDNSISCGNADGSFKPVNIALLCEYDALPDVGHGCGHNLIAEVGAGAAVGIKAALIAARCSTGKITVIGTPAEEAGGGKIDLINAGAFGDVDVALMSHPGCYSSAFAEFSSLREKYEVSQQTRGFSRAVVARVRVTFHGRASHVACDPQDGVNALDAAVMAYSNIACLRQQMRPKWCVSGIITKGGSVPNVIPHETELFYNIRAPTVVELHELIQKIKACFEAAALATGCKVEYSWEQNFYLNMVNNRSLADCYKSHAVRLGVELTDESEVKAINMGSSDIGNVSHILPSLHPTFYFGAQAPEHSDEFANQAGCSKAQFYAIREAKLLALTALDVLLKPGLLTRIRCDFNEEIKRMQNNCEFSTK